MSEGLLGVGRKLFVIVFSSFSARSCVCFFFLLFSFSFLLLFFSNGKCVATVCHCDEHHEGVGCEKVSKKVLPMGDAHWRRVEQLEAEKARAEALEVQVESLQQQIKEYEQLIMTLIATLAIIAVREY